jgi:HAD superfamily hydrolase (TIGR01509 family)
VNHQARLRAVAFDLDGLLVNTEELYETVGGELLRRRGHVLEEQLLAEMMGRPSRVALPLMIQWYGLGDTPEQLELETDAIFAEILPQRIEPMPGVPQLLDWLESRGIPKIVATSSRREFAEKVLSLLDWRHRFQFLLASLDVQQGKPHPEIYQMAARRLGISPQELLVLEDSQNGCRAAVAAGSCCIAVPHRRSANHEFPGVGLVADTLADPQVYNLLAQRLSSSVPAGDRPFFEGP